MNKLYTLSVARDGKVTCNYVTFLKYSIDISLEMILRAFVVAAIIYIFCPRLRRCYDVSTMGGAYAPAMELCSTYLS